MIEAERFILLDTNILVHLLRGQAAGTWIDESFQLRKRPYRPLVSVISVGEILALAEKWDWGPRRRQEIDSLLATLTILDIRHQEILQRYAIFSTRWERAGLRMEQNDLWIAASAGSVNAVLLTTDDDFKKLSEVIQVQWVDSQHLRRLNRSS